MFTIKKIVVESKQKKVLADVEGLSFSAGNIALIIGKNGSGKTSFLHGIFSYPDIFCSSRDIFLDTNDVSKDTLIDLYVKGLHYVPQHLIPLPGVSFISFLHIAYEKKYGEKISLLVFLKKVKDICKNYRVPEYLLEKNVHENLSGGERKMQELIQILTIQPRYIFLDEIDSGLDRDAKILVAGVINALKKEGVGIVLVSHSFDFANILEIDQVHVLDAGFVVQSGDFDLFTQIQKEGFK